MPKIEIDGTVHEVEDGQNVLQACLSTGLDLPYFCWHPAMGSVGACRQCMVTQYSSPEDTKGRLVVGCMTPVSEGLRISLNDSEAVEFRADIIELLMTNHPHDCPVCEEGGQCHLQDMTVMSGHTSRKYRGKKRTHRNQYLGPFIGHEMNRCIACYRCVRYYQDYAGGQDLGVFGAHNHVYFGRSEDGVLENEFSGNLVEVCPTGVFTDKSGGKNYSRKWDLQTAPSICAHCSLGCNTTPGERYGELRSVVNRYHGEINRYFLCDRGRFGYGFVNAESRIRTASIDDQQMVGEGSAVDHFRGLIRARETVIGIGSPRASVESNYALRELVGEDQFYSGWTEAENTLMATALRVIRETDAANPTLAEIERADAVLILGEDLTNTAPIMALAVRQAVRNASFDAAESVGIPQWQDAAVRELAQDLLSPLFVASTGSTRLDDVATGVYRASPDEIARLGFAVANRLDSSAPGVGDLAAAASDTVNEIAEALANAERPLVISGTGCMTAAVLEAASNIARALASAGKALSVVVPDCNSMGLAMMDGHGLEDAKKVVEFGVANTVVVIENDLYRNAPRELVDDVLGKAKNVVVIDHGSNATTEKAGLVLPATSFAEAEGTYINNEGRAQRFFSVMQPSEEMRNTWQWLADAGAGDWSGSDDIIASCGNDLLGFKGVEEAAPSAAFRISGMKVPRQSHRYSGRTAMRANLAVSEPQQPIDQDSALSFSMEGAGCDAPSSLRSTSWAPAWNSNHSIIKFQQEVGGSLQGGDPGIRLFEPSSGTNWYDSIPASSEPIEGRWLVVPSHQIFGSEPQSCGSPALAERIDAFSVTLNGDDLARLQIESGEMLELSIDGNATTAEARQDDGVPSGVVAVGCGVPGSEGIAWLKQAEIRKRG